MSDPIEEAAEAFANLSKQQDEDGIDHPEMFYAQWSDAMIYSTASDGVGIYLAYAAPGCEGKSFWVPDDVIPILKKAIADFDKLQEEKKNGTDR
jgi:hypothetical protein